MMISFMQKEQLFVSDLCTKTKEMFSMLESEDPKPDKYDPNGSFAYQAILRVDLPPKMAVSCLHEASWS